MCTNMSPLSAKLIAVRSKSYSCLHSHISYSRDVWLLQKNDMKKGQYMIPTLLHEEQNPRSMGQWYQFYSLTGPNESHPHEIDFSWEKFLVTHHAPSYIYSVEKRNPISSTPNLRLSSEANILNRKSQNPSIAFIIKKEHLQENDKNWNSKRLYVFSAR